LSGVPKTGVLCWSPDGTKIAYKGRGIDQRDTEIYTIGLGPEHKVVQVTNNSTRKDGEPSYSPDGKKIAYEGKDGQDREIYTIDAVGGG
jgi:Tol biopolymer transport system component